MYVTNKTYTISIRKKEYFSKGFSPFFYLFFVVFFLYTSISFLYVAPNVYAYAQSDTPLQTLEDIQDLPETIHIALHDKKINLNFYKGLSNIESHVHTALFSGLVSLDPNTLSIQNNLAISWFTNDDITEYTFHLRKEAVFSDGSVVTANDVKESWLAILRTKSGFSYLLEPIVGVLQYQNDNGTLDEIGIDVVSDRTLRVRLERPNSEFIKIIAHSVFSVVKAEFSTIEDWENQVRSISYSGPYIISEIEDTHILLQKNQLFWAKKFIKAEYVVLHFYDEEKEQVAQNIVYENIHWSTFNIDNDEITSWVKKNAIFGTNYLYFRSARKPWNNANLRTAIRLLIPFDEIRTNEYSYPASTLVPQLYDEYFPPEVDSKQDIETSLSMLELLGYPNGDGLPPLVILVPSYNGEYEKIFDILKFYIEEATTISVDIQTRPSDEYYTALSTEDFVMGSNAWIGDYVSPAAFLQMWLAPMKALGHAYNNEEYRDLYMKAISNSDEDKKAEALQDVERVLLETSVVIPLSHLYAVNIVRDDILEGWETNILDQHHFATLYQKEKKPAPFITQYHKK